MTIGAVAAPLFAAGSAIRAARLFHPVGVVHEARVRADHPLGERLAGRAMVRFSGAIWRRDRAPDLLGLAIRFRGPRPPAVDPDPRDQDLLLVTFRSLAELPIALARTDPHDFLANDYTGGAWFWVPGVGRARIELHPLERSPAVVGDRADRLVAAIERETAILAVRAVEPGREALRLATITVGPRLRGVDPALRFDPFRAGAGITPLGVIQGMRAAVYPRSQAARPRS